MNEVDPKDTTDFSASPPMALTIGVLSLLHVLCCGVLLPLAAGVSLASIFPWELGLSAAVLIGALLF